MDDPETQQESSGRIRSFLNSVWTIFVGLGACVGFWADIPIEKSRLDDTVSTLFPLAAVLLPYVIFAATIYFGGKCLLWSYNVAMFLKAGGPAREHFSTYQPQIDGLLRLLRIFRRAEEENEMDIEIEAKLLVELAYFARHMEKLNVWAPPIDPVARNNVKPWVEYLVRLDVLARHGYLKEARELGPG